MYTFTTSESLDSEGSPKKVKSLIEIYESYSFALFLADPSTFEDANKIEGWKQAMNDKIVAIERNNM